MVRHRPYRSFLSTCRRDLRSAARAQKYYERKREKEKEEKEKEKEKESGKCPVLNEW